MQIYLILCVHSSRSIHVFNILPFLCYADPKKTKKKLVKSGFAFNPAEMWNDGNKKLPMLPETRTLLDGYYQPHNKKLAALLEDKRFLWL